MPHSIELLPAADGDAALRAQWSRLAEARLPTAGKISADTNRPHCTLLAGTEIDPAADAALAAVAMRLPAPVVIGAPTVFAQHAGYTLVRIVTPGAELLGVHAQTARVAGEFVTGLSSTSAPGHWTPHFTLARRMTADQIAAALDLLDWAPIDTAVTALRRWNGDEKTDVVIPGRDC
ncbi:MAG: 2'-5' RNA ligase family protein [Gordonia sp. (in: high G+C Gram-positive bacteria)]